MISAFGEKSQSFAKRIGDLNAIICDANWIGAAYREAVRRRELGESFYGLVCVDDPRLDFGYKNGEQILAQLPDFDTRCYAIDRLVDGTLAVNGAQANTLYALDPGFEHVSTEFLWLCDAVLVRSFMEYERLVGWFARDPVWRPMRPVERILAAPTTTIPVVKRMRPEQPCVIVWAPERPALECALHLHGLAEFHGDVVCVSAGGSLPSQSTATFLQPGDAEVSIALSRASAIVCIDPSDPADAVAFARLGYGVVAPITSGAHEFASDIVPWDALDTRFLFTSVAVGIARPASVRCEPEPPPNAPLRSPRPTFVDPNDLPLVSIITPTYNRPGDLRKMLSCIAAQTYPNIESVVVNDGGIAVDDVVAEFPFARLIDKKPNAGTARAQLTGWENARGTYIGLLPDDDWLYPDHVERLVNAIVRSGAQVAHGAGLLRYLDRGENDAWKTVGFNATTFCQTLAASDALISSTIGGHQTLIHRSVYEAVGWYLLDSDVSDNEWHLRTTQRWFYAYDDHVTAEFRDHPAGQGRQIDFTVALRQIYEEVHPVMDRPLIDRMRALTLDHVAKRVPGKSPFTPTLTIL